MTGMELLGKICGYPLGVLTATGSLLRRSRLFHPKGDVFLASVDSETLAPFALVRISAALWKTERSFDPLGIALRLGSRPPNSPRVNKEDQDLLFATIKTPWRSPFSPLSTRSHDFFENNYYGVSPFKFQSEQVYLKLTPLNPSAGGSNRKEKLYQTVNAGKAVFILMARGKDEKTWKEKARIKLERPLAIDQESLRFNPFQNGAGIVPLGFVHHLRIGAYKLSQLARPKQEKKSRTRNLS